MSSAIFHRIILAAALALGAGGHCAVAASPDTPTHKEIEPIMIPLGTDGHLKTISMDHKGNLLVGVSWSPDGAKKAEPKQPANTASTKSEEGGATTIIERVNEAVYADSKAEWDKLVKDVTPDQFREAMLNMQQAERRKTMQSLPPEVRQKLAPNYGQPGGPGRTGGPGGQMSNARGGILPQLATDAEGHVYALKVVSPEGKVLATWEMTDGLAPKMIFGCPDGTVYVAGGGRLAQFSGSGKLLKQVNTDLIYGTNAAASGLCADDKNVYIAFGMGNSVRATEDIYRFKRDLSEPKRIVERQYGCCSHIDLRVVNDQLLIAENSRHRVNSFDLDGKQLGTWGRRDRESLEAFTACCNPCNFDLGTDGILYTAESGVGRVKKYSPDGKFLGLVGYVDTTKFDNGGQLAATSCYIPMEVNHDASRIYVMDIRAHIIRVLAKN